MTAHITPEDLDGTKADHVAEPVTGWSPFNLLWMSLLAVAVWPVLGVSVSHHLFDDPSEAAFLFGGMTACLLYLPALLVGSSDIGFMVALVFLWLLMWLLPIRWLIRHPRDRGFQSIYIMILSAVSLAQAALGYLLILGKGV